ncbi:MAG: class I fructose-bisphosphate aldolase [Alphaproteobacteria bacterium]|nr:class I fructose-bisphosphate aldolase [Alphaproteobacteria bacterium]
MQITKCVKKILYNYDSDNPGAKTNLARILMHGKTSGSGKMVVFSAEHGFENGSACCYSNNPQAFDPHYLYQLAVDAQVSAFAAPLGLLEAGAGYFAGAVPTILKLNSSNDLNTKKLEPTQAITGSVQDALRLGCVAVGFTIFPCSDRADEMFEDLREIANEAKSCGLAVMVWAHPKGGFLSRNGETAIDTVAYSAHIAALMGAHIIKVKMPELHIEQPKAKSIYKNKIQKLEEQSARVRHIVQSCFNGRRLVLFSGARKSGLNEIYNETMNIRNGSGSGTILGKDLFQREHDEAVKLVNKIAQIYQE